MEYLPIILTVALIHLLAVMSPGPDFIMILRNSLLYSRRSGVHSAIGLGLAIWVHVTYCLAGIALIISQSVLLFNIVKFIGAAYLIYIGIQSIRAGRAHQAKIDQKDQSQDLTKWQAIRIGFITNVTNPKATLFFLSLFTLVIQPETPLIVKLIMGIEMSLVTTAWFVLVAALVSHRLIRKRISTIQHYVTRLMGGLLILFGLKLAATHSK